MKKHTKSTLALVIALSCINLCGCDDKGTSLYNPDDSSETIKSEINTEDLDSIDETTHPSETESDTPARQAIKEISGMYEQNGQKMPELALMFFTEETDSAGSVTEIDKNSLPMNDGTIKAGLNLLVYSPEDTECTVKGSFVMFWNGKPYDFSVDDKQSKDGALQLELIYNNEVVLPFESKNLPVQEGENTLYFCFIPYCEESGKYLMSQRNYAYFNSEQTLDGTEPIAVTEETELPQESVGVIPDKNTAGTYYQVKQSDIISSNKEKYTLHSNPTFYLNISNLTNHDAASNRSGIGMLFADGELQPIWNGKKYLSTSLSSSEMRKTISAETSYQSGEKHDVCMVYAELTDDMNLDDKPYIYSEMTYCIIEE